MKFLAVIVLCAPLLANALTAKSYIVMDEDGNVLTEHNATTRMPIASITKLFTAERNADLPGDELITILKEDMKLGRMRSTVLKPGLAYKRSELMALALVNSDNVAAIALGRSSNMELTPPPNTTLVEASGLDPQNMSTAMELAHVARSLVNTPLASYSVMPNVTIDGKLRRSTNPLIENETWHFLLSKTGFIDLAGGCVVVVMKVKERIMTIVVLGASSVRQRWCDLAELRAKFDEGFTTPKCKTSHKKPERVKITHRQRSKVVNGSTSRAK